MLRAGLLEMSLRASQAYPAMEGEAIVKSWLSIGGPGVLALTLPTERDDPWQSVGGPRVLAAIMPSESDDPWQSVGSPRVQSATMPTESNDPMADRWRPWSAGS